mmetsp:Transcript_12217/g.37260  ORF Transcript_12217/g.37260 Transcript_12217/m.37260 type:complete len:424 (-) Transcript_12217:256-1527(-)
MMDLVEPSEGHESRMVAVADRGTQTDEPYEPHLDFDGKEKKSRGRKRKSMEEPSGDIDPNNPLIDEIEFKRVEQLTSAKRLRLKTEKIKPIEELTFDDIKKYNRNQLRAYCSIYGVKRKRKGEMEHDLARYAAHFHPNDSNFDVSKFQPTEYSGIPFSRKQPANGSTGDFSPGPHPHDQSLQLSDSQMIAGHVDAQVLASDQHMSHQMVHHIGHPEHHLHAGDHQMAGMPVDEHQMTQEHSMAQEHQMGHHHPMNEHQMPADTHIGPDQHLQGDHQHMGPEHLQGDQHIAGDGHLAGDQHMAGEHHMGNEPHIGQDQHHLSTDQHLAADHQLSAQDGQYGEVVMGQGGGGVADINGEPSVMTHFTENEVHEQGDGNADGTDLEGGLGPDVQDGADHSESAHHHTSGTDVDDGEDVDNAGVENP